MSLHSQPRRRLLHLTHPQHSSITLCLFALLSFVAVLGIPYYLSIERTIYFADQHPGEWGHPELKILLFPNNKTYQSKLSKDHPYKFTPVVGHGKQKRILSSSELILDIDSRIKTSEPKIWRPLDPIKGYNRFWFQLPDIRYGFPMGPNEMLDMTFPGPGTYNFQWHVLGGDIAPIHRSFKIRLD